MGLPVLDITAKQRANLSSWNREHQGCAITAANLQELLALKTPAVGERADKILLFLAEKFPLIGQNISTARTISGNFVDDGSRFAPANCASEDDLLGVSWSEATSEVKYLISDYLISEKSYLETTPKEYLRITPRGWAYIHSLTQGNPESRSGFIAMWFANEMNDAWKAIDYGIRQAGYDAVRIDQKQHNNKIDDEIIAGIRRSKLLVADFTGHRGGVYFEAGLAMGIGLPVIWLCRHDHLKEVHFDTRQYNFIVWETHKLEELSKALQNRIEATLGRGPLIGNP
jgi:hypothetical protein